MLGFHVWLLSLVEVGVLRFSEGERRRSGSGGEQRCGGGTGVRRGRDLLYEKRINKKGGKFS